MNLEEQIEKTILPIHDHHTSDLKHGQDIILWIRSKKLASGCSKIQLNRFLKISAFYGISSGKDGYLILHFNTSFGRWCGTCGTSGIEAVEYTWLCRLQRHKKISSDQT